MSKFLCEWQLDLFDSVTPTETEDLRRYVLILKQVLDNVRKGTFQRLHDMQKIIEEQKDHIYFLQASVRELNKSMGTFVANQDTEANEIIDEEEESFGEFSIRQVVNQEKCVSDKPKVKRRKLASRIEIGANSR